jgi:carbonic anhydrase/acetyltransferase-like protein (isoleucine patch superfamily)
LGPEHASGEIMALSSSVTIPVWRITASSTPGLASTIGHGAVIHNVEMMHDYVIVGMGAVVSDWAVIGEWAVVGEGAVVRQRQEIPPSHIAVGVPAKVLEKTVGEEYKAQWTQFKKVYVDLARRYPTSWVPEESS